MARSTMTPCRHCGGEHDTSIDRLAYCDEEREYHERISRRAARGLPLTVPCAECGRTLNAVDYEDDEPTETWGGNPLCEDCAGPLD